MQVKYYQGGFQPKGKRFAIIVARFNELISDQLTKGALNCLEQHGAEGTDIEVIRVPGAFEIPLVAERCARSGKYDALICLGAVIRGNTPHFDYVAAEVSKGIAQVAQKNGLPVSFGVLTTDNIEQALERAGTKAGNKGWDAALTAMEMVDLLGQLAQPDAERNEPVSQLP